MPLPIAIPIALGALGLGSQLLGGQAQQRAQERAARDQKAANRRAAIERAMGGTSFSRPYEPAAPIDTSSYAAFTGLANLGSALSMLPGAPPKVQPPPQVYT